MRSTATSAGRAEGGTSGHPKVWLGRVSRYPWASDGLDAGRSAGGDQVALSEHESGADRYFGLAAVDDALGYLYLYEDRKGEVPPHAEIIRRDLSALRRVLEPERVVDDRVAVQLALSLIENRKDAITAERAVRGDPTVLQVKVEDTIVVTDSFTVGSAQPPGGSSGPVEPGTRQVPSGGGAGGQQALGYTDVSAKQIVDVPQWARLAIERAIRLPATPPPSTAVVAAFADELQRRVDEMGAVSR